MISILNINDISYVPSINPLIYDHKTIYIYITRRKGRARNNIEEKEEKREEDKIGKETRALQVPCGSETYGYSGENNK